jgi:hypothetical protein
MGIKKPSLREVLGTLAWPQMVSTPLIRLINNQDRGKAPADHRLPEGGKRPKVRAARAILACRPVHNLAPQRISSIGPALDRRF